MNNLQFNLDEDSLYSPMSPEVIDISSNSENEFMVEPGNIPQIEERFRVDQTPYNAMSTFMGAATAMLFPPNSIAISQNETIDTAGTGIEQELMELIEENRVPTPTSITSFVDSEYEGENGSPVGLEPVASEATLLNSYGRPSAAILPTPRSSDHQVGQTSREIPTYPPNYRPGVSAFHPQPIVQSNVDPTVQEVVPAEIHVMPTYDESPLGVASGNMTPLIIQLPPRGGPGRPQELVFPMIPGVQWGFPFSVVHSQNVLLIPISVRQNCRLFPTVMPNVAGYCDQCGKTYDEVALETLGNYLGATAYSEETVRDRGVRSRAFIDGFEAALFLFKSAGLSQPDSCAGTGVHR